MKAGIAEFTNGIDLWLKRARSMTTAIYREMVWDLFLTVVRETPQWSGKAVANWNISINDLGLLYDDSLGDPNVVTRLNPMENDAFSSKAPHKKGDRKWERVAWDRNRPIKDSIQMNDRVFIYNWTVGDEDYSYLEGFQKSVLWPTKLREVNRPYETVQQSVAIVTHRWAAKGMNMLNTRGDRLGGSALEDAYS